MILNSFKLLTVLFFVFRKQNHMRTIYTKSQPLVECHTIFELPPYPNFEIAQCYIYDDQQSKYRVSIFQ